MASNYQAQAYHNLYLMLDSGVPILRALEMSGKATRGPIRRAWQHVRLDVQNGESLAQAMRKHPKAFALLDTAIIEAGEVSGNLPASLQRLEQWYSFMADLKSKVRSGMALPVIILLVAGFVIPLPNYILSHIPSVSSGPPMSTAAYIFRALIPIAVLIIPLTALVCVMRGTNRGGPLRIVLDWIALKIPILGAATKQLAVSRYLRAFHTLFKAGVPVIRTATMSAQITGNAVVCRWVIGAASSAEQGFPLSEGFTREFPRLYREAWQVGEESGKLADVIGRLADQAEEKALWQMAQLGKWLPIVIYAAVAIWMIKMIFTMWSNIYSSIM